MTDRAILITEAERDLLVRALATHRLAATSRPDTDDAIAAMIARIAANHDNLRAHALSCPYCGSPDGIRGGFVEIDGTEAIQGCSCSECGTEWTNTYSWTRREITGDPDQDDEGEQA